MTKNESNVLASNRILTDKISSDPNSRLTKLTKRVIAENNFVIDPHVHYFDMHCINKGYFLLRMVKDLLHLKSIDNEEMDINEENIYYQKEYYFDKNENWMDELKKEIVDNKIQITSSENTKGFFDKTKVTKLLGLKRMEDVYSFYLSNYSFAEACNSKDVITTLLQMDLEMGWDVNVNKSMKAQIEEIKILSENKPILPFLACHPKRVSVEDSENELYNLFNLAFCTGETSFFGIKLYPSLGYHPNDFRLWPIYKICEEKHIPVLTHCGGSIVSTDNTNFDVFDGEDLITYNAKNRKEMANKLNNPELFTKVLEQFPQLKLCFGHFGGFETWGSTNSLTSNDLERRKDVIINFMDKYDNIYADFAYNLVESKLCDNLISYITNPKNSLVRSRSLFGTDFWVVLGEGDLMKYQKNFVKSLNQYKSLKEDVTKDNSMNYLFSKSVIS